MLGKRLRDLEEDLCSIIDRTIDSFAKSHDGYSVKWFAVYGTTGRLESICFTVTAGPEKSYRITSADGADGVRSIAAVPVCDGGSSVSRTASASTMLHANMGPEYVIDTTLNSMVDALKELMKQERFGYWVMPDE